MPFTSSDSNISHLLNSSASVDREPFASIPHEVKLKLANELLPEVESLASALKEVEELEQFISADGIEGK